MPTISSQKIKRTVSLSDIQSEADIDNLTVKKIKEILHFNRAEYTYRDKRKELVKKLKRLRGLEKRVGVDQSLKTSRSNNNFEDRDLCKVCLDSTIDCVLLDCGHMCSCLECAEQMTECPICRNTVVQVTRVFKA